MALLHVQGETQSMDVSNQTTDTAQQGQHVAPLLQVVGAASSAPMLMPFNPAFIGGAGAQATDSAAGDPTAAAMPASNHGSHLGLAGSPSQQLPIAGLANTGPAPSASNAFGATVHPSGADTGMNGSALLMGQSGLTSSQDQGPLFPGLPASQQQVPVL